MREAASAGGAIIIEGDDDGFRPTPAGSAVVHEGCDDTGVTNRVPIDMAYLAAQTCDDALLQAELLRLFVDQARAICMRITDPFEAERATQADIAADLHTLKGSAGAIGAMHVAQRAAALESDGGHSPANPRRAAQLAALRSAVDDACGFAATILAPI